MPITRKYFRYLVIGLAILLQTHNPALAQSGKKQSIFEYLTQQEGAKLIIESDFTALTENRKSDEYIPATFTTAEGKVFQANLKPRGKYRRKICDIPPLKVKFSKKMLVAAGFDTLNEVKLVIPCYDNNMGENLILKEYITYRMFEMLSGASVRARLVKITLRDNHVERSKRQVLALLVEDEEETCARLNGIEKEVYGISPDSLQMNQAAMVAMFEYMIGNTDWDISMMRNVRLIYAPETGKTLIVPYDFDFSGLVNAPYASPSSESGLLSVRDRYLMANGISEDALKRATNTIRGARKDLTSMCRNKYLPKETSAEMIQYLDIFFQSIENADSVPSTMRAPSD